MGYGVPTRPAPSPAIQTGWYADPRNRGRSPDDIIASLPTFSSFEEAIRSPALAGFSDPEKTNYLRDAYGLSGEWKIQNGQIVHAAPWVARNAWWLAPAAMVGGSALPGLFSAAAGPGAGSHAAAIAAGALPTTIPAETVGFGTGLGAELGGTMAGGIAKKGLGLIDWAKILGQPIGDLIGAHVGANASTEAARIAAAATEKALALQERMYQQDRADFAPYLAAGGGAATRMSDLLRQTTPPALPSSVQAAMNAPPQSAPAFSSPSNAYLQPNAPPVRLMAPTGEQRTFASDDPTIDGYLQRGARRLA